MLPHTQILDTLLCEEDHFDTTENTLLQHQHSLNSDSFLTPFEQDDELRSLLHKEQQNEPHRRSQTKPQIEEVIQWMLRVIAYYSFSPLTAVLAVTYLDRFLHRYDSDKPWMFQLAAVASLSLASKVEETDVPLLLDFQVEEPIYVFEPRNIQKMEILILSTLEWKMNLITPFSFLDYIARRLLLNEHLCGEFLARCQRLILSVIADIRFMAYLPSTMATATMIHVITTIEPSIDSEHHDRLLGILGINKDKVQDCCMLIQEVATNVRTNKRKFGSLPCSPKGVFDLSFISDSSPNDSWAVASNSSSVSSSPQLKKIKTSDRQSY
ncbi:cyclin-D3-1-like [Salvia splendens]|uniref:cyclin-D3-1-like n=1 Tax=Salvia splendens TaxID=180675 RepID=UPI001C2555C0|nr:cyclin-D3-1-like [Salvia splendens]